MKYLLDTNAVIALLNGNATINRRVREYASDDFGLSAIVFHELYFGAYRSARQAHNLHRVDQLRFEVLDFSREDARAAGALRAELANGGTPIGPYDVLIAAQALTRGLILVTHNTCEFLRLAGLIVDDWEA